MQSLEIAIIIQAGSADTHHVQLNRIGTCILHSFGKLLPFTIGMASDRRDDGDSATLFCLCDKCKIISDYLLAHIARQIIISLGMVVSTQLSYLPHYRLLKEGLQYDGTRTGLF